MRGPAEESARPKYAHVERERRWLVDAHVRPALESLAPVLIEDRYIRRTRLRLRQMTDSASGARVWKLTRKYEAADSLARPIVTAYLTEEEHGIFASLDADPLVKRRYPLDHQGLSWSLDCFDGALDGLCLLEVEAPDDATLRALEPPAWAGEDVSDDSRYAGATLAANGLGTG